MVAPVTQNEDRVVSVHNPDPAPPVVSALQQEANESLQRRTKTITTEQILREVHAKDAEQRVYDREVRAAFDPQNPIPLSKITLPDSELGMTVEEREAQRNKFREAREERNARRLASALKA